MNPLLKTPTLLWMLEEKGAMCAAKTTVTVLLLHPGNDLDDRLNQGFDAGEFPRRPAAVRGWSS